MDEVGEDALDGLTRIELHEARLLSWGATGAEWTEAELLALLSEYGDGPDLLTRLTDTALIVRTPSGGYRSRSAETVRLLATLRQAFRASRVTEGRPLVLDYRFLHRARRRPARDVPARDMLEDLTAAVGTAGATAVRGLLPTKLSGFQRRASGAILGSLATGRGAGVMVTAGTGSGKTLAFYLPLLTWLAAEKAGRQGHGTRALALYPRNELLKDQLRTLVGYARHMREAGTPISLATWFGPTPASANALQQGWADGWQSRGGGFVCPFLTCPDCGSDLLWRQPDLASRRERLTCVSRSCSCALDGDLLRLTRDSARRDPATLVLSTTESLNRQLAAPGNLRAFGIRPGTLAAVLLDEVHVYEGAAGAQNAILMRRLSHALGRTPVWAGLSATLRNAGEFFAQLTGLSVGAVTVVAPNPAELEEVGAEYLLALRHNPHARTGTMSTTIQTCMALARCLDSATDNPFDPAPSSQGVFGSRIFAFTDKLDSTNRLYWDLLDAEGWRWPGVQRTRKVLTLAHLRGEHQDRLAKTLREPASERDPAGQYWWLPELLGHDVDADRQLRLGRTSSQDRGVEADSQIVIATATLEVGFDDDRVGAVVQHKAPRDAAQFLQRKGRGGRNVATRPWTVVVLSDWGRDRQAWEAYDALFDPELAPRHLPIENLYVLRIQAVYAMLDWIAAELNYTGTESVWHDLAGPAVALYPGRDTRRDQTLDRQRRVAELLTRLLRPGPERERLRRHLRAALALGSGELAESVTDSLLWEAPRPLLPVVIATIRRRLADQWLGEEPADGDAGLRTRTPLREFVPGNLFDDLLVPDVQLAVPGLRQEITTEHLPALRAISEFCPGNVTRHFGIWASNKRHWIPLPEPEPDGGERRIDVRGVYQAVPLELVGEGDEQITVFAPTTASVEAVPSFVRDASAVRPDWEFTAAPLGKGTALQVVPGLAALFDGLNAHLHVQGGGVRTLRYARTVSGTLWAPRPQPVQVRLGTGTDTDWAPAALGVEVHCDAIEGVVRMPDRLEPPDSPERSQRLRHLLETELSLPAAMSALDRESLAEIALLAAATADVQGGPALWESDLSGALLAAAATLDLIPEDDTEDDREQDNGIMQWQDWCTDPTVLSAVGAALAETSQDTRSDPWTAWWRRRHTLSAGYLTVAALATLCPGIDADELLVDLDPETEGVFWICESAPGGTGQIEAFARSVAEEPTGLTRALEEAMRPTPVETMDDELTALLDSDEEELKRALARLRESWSEGHEAAALAVRRLEATAFDHGLALSGPARSALSTRIAGPGAHPELPAAIGSWLRRREEVAVRSRFAVGARTLGGLLAADPGLDELLYLERGVTAQRRARAVANVLWPWGEAAEPSLGYNPYARGPRTSLAALRSAVSLEPPRFCVADWSTEQRAGLHDLLRDNGEVVLYVPHTHAGDLRAAVLDLLTTPVEVGTLLCHPVIVGMRYASRLAEARLLLREAL